MDRWVDCEDCRHITGGFDNGRRCKKHFMLQRPQSVQDAYNTNYNKTSCHTGVQHDFVPCRPKSDIEIIIEKLEKIEERIDKLEKGE